MAKDDSKTIKVTDRRMFTADGELRDDSQAVGESTIDESSGPEEEHREPVLDRPGFESGRAASVARLPSPTFRDLVAMLAEPTALFLGDARLPNGESAENLDLARFHIDLLEVLRRKTDGNLTQEEAAMLGDLLYTLRLRYVRKKS